MDLTNVILEMQSRIIQLEQEVAQLKKQMASVSLPNSVAENDSKESANAVRTRDKTRYIFREVAYLKNRLVLEVVQAFVAENYPISKEELLRVFPKQLQGSIGVVADIETAKQRKDYDLRFFTDDDEIVHLSNGEMVVCSQWGILNIPNFVEHARTLGYEIKEIKN